MKPCDLKAQLVDRDVLVEAILQRHAQSPLSSNDEEELSIPKEDAVTLSYSQFFERYMLPNKPVVIMNACKEWPSIHNWVDRSDPTAPNGRPNLDYFVNNLPPSSASCSVTVAICDSKDFSDQKRECMNLADYIEYWKQHASKDSKEEKILYLKDWHYVKNFPKCTAYTLPIYFSDDWINLYWDHRKDIDDDYRFVYMGPAGSWTPLHADVFNTYSWSSNICGRKEWIFYSPDQGQYLKDKYGRDLMYDVHRDQLDTATFPHYHKARPIRVIQEAGETVFVPSGWYHQVTNLEDTISINHNWANACNVEKLWERLKGDWVAVEKELDDFKGTDDWEMECQKVLRLLAGWNIEEFISFLLFMAERQFDTLTQLGFDEQMEEEEKEKEKGKEQEKKKEQENRSAEESKTLMAIFNLTRLWRVLGEVLVAVGEGTLQEDKKRQANETLYKAECCIAKQKKAL